MPVGKGSASISSPQAGVHRGESAIRKVETNIGGDVGEFAPLPSFLSTHGLQVALRPVHADCDTVDERKRLRVFCKYRRKHATDDVSRFSSCEY